MSKTFTDEATDLNRTSQDKKIHEFKDSFWETLDTFVISLQSRWMEGKMEYRTVSYCLESGKQKILHGIEVDSISKLVGEQPIKVGYQEGNENFSLIDTLSGSQPEANVYSPLISKTMPKHPDEPIEYVTDELELVNKLESALQHNFVTPPQISTHASKSFDLPTEDESELSTEDQPELTPVKEATKVLNLTSEDATLSEEENLQEEEPAEPLKLEITQVRVYPPEEPDKAPDLDNESGETEATDIEDDKQEQAIVIDASKRILMGELPRGISIDLEVVFQLKGEGALELTHQPLNYHTKVYGENRKTRQKLTLGQAPVGKLVNGKLTYTCRLAEVILSEASTYRLQFFTHLDDAPVSPDLLELPFVQVA